MAGGSDGRAAAQSSRVTLAQVAAEAGVSLATASKVINGRRGVGAMNRMEIEKVADRLGYVGVSQREGVSRGTREPIIEIILHSLQPYAVAVIAGALSAAEAAEAVVVVRRTDELERQPASRWAQRAARTGRIGVVEVASEFSLEREKALRSAGLPVVLIDPLNVPATSTISVGATDWAGALEATRHLMEIGHTRIAYVGGPRGSACDLARTHGYAAAMEQASLPTDLGNVPHGPFTFEHGVAAGLELLSRPERPTAIFAGNDEIAIGVMEAARTLGISVPAELSIVGFDDTFLASKSTPRLTTVHQPVEEIGRTAVEMVLRLARGETLPSRRVELATHLVLRDSTAPLE